MNHRFAWVGLLALCALMILTGPARADGIIVPDPVCKTGNCPPQPPCLPNQLCPPRPLAQLAIRYHRVLVKIEGQVAVTHVDQVFYNPNDWSMEGSYIFPLPAGAAVSQFILWVDGKPEPGKVLSAEEARRYYEETVRQQRDPALLEFSGRGAVQAHIFPIPPRGERRIELEYSQVLTAESGLLRYTYPLSTEKFSSVALENVSVSVEIHAQQALRAVYSPSHSVSLDRKDARSAVAGWEAKNVRPDQDFVLYASIGESDALHLLTYRDPQDPQNPDGFFLLLLAPRFGVPEQAVAKDVILVLDRSGSMEGEKFRQAQAALRYILQHLGPDDRFGLEAFSTSVQAYARELRPAREVDEAVAWVDRLSASGSTDINRALLESAAMADPERPTYLIFLTDGLPTTGETRREKILDNFAGVVRKNVRLFAFGVGYDVDTFLLDTLSQQQHGQSSYVRPGEKLDEALSAFFERIRTPVLTDLALDFGRLSVYDVYPNPLPDLFSGSQVIVTGRYHASGTTDLTLTGNINGQNQAFHFVGQAFTENSLGAGPELTHLPRLWATRKVGALLNQIRLKGADAETVAQIVRLSIRFGIVTPYTSYLVSEGQPLGAENQQRVAQDALKSLQAAPPAAASGQGAVQKSAEQSALAQADRASAPSADAAQNVLVLGARTFVNSQGVWQDTTYDPKKMQPVRVTFLSDEYFKLAQRGPEAAAALGLGARVIVVLDGVAYEISPDAVSALPPTALPMGQKTPSPAQLSTPGQSPAARVTPILTSPAPNIHPVADVRQWLWVALFGAGILVAFGVSLAVWLRRRR